MHNEKRKQKKLSSAKTSDGYPHECRITLILQTQIPTKYTLARYLGTNFASTARNVCLYQPNSTSSHFYYL